MVVLVLSVSAARAVTVAVSMRSNLATSSSIAWRKLVKVPMRYWIAGNPGAFEMTPGTSGAAAACEQQLEPVDGGRLQSAVVLIAPLLSARWIGCRFAENCGRCRAE